MAPLPFFILPVFLLGKGCNPSFQSACQPVDQTVSVESWGDSVRIRQVVVGVKVAVDVDNPSIEVAVVHVQAAERTGPEIRAVVGLPLILCFMPHFVYTVNVTV